MRPIILTFAVVLGCASLVAAQDSSKDQITVQGCVNRSNGDYTLVKTDPAVTYELQGSGKVKLRAYLGQRVEVTGDQSPSLSTSSDAMARQGSASPVTIRVSSIRTIDKECGEKPAK